MISINKNSSQKYDLNCIANEVGLDRQFEISLDAPNEKDVIEQICNDICTDITTTNGLPRRVNVPEFMFEVSPTFTPTLSPTICEINDEICDRFSIDNFIECSDSFLIENCQACECQRENGCYYNENIINADACFCQMNQVTYETNQVTLNLIFLVDTSNDSFSDTQQTQYARSFVNVIANVFETTLPNNLENINSIRIELIQYGTNQFIFLNFTESILLTNEELVSRTREMGTFPPNRLEIIGQSVNTSAALEFAMNRFEILNNIGTTNISNEINMLYVFTREEGRNIADTNNACDLRRDLDSLRIQTYVVTVERLGSFQDLQCLVDDRFFEQNLELNSRQFRGTIDEIINGFFVTQFISSDLCIIDSFNITDIPTLSPTLRPTISPTINPTNSTDFPTPLPTQSPVICPINDEICEQRPTPDFLECSIIEDCESCECLRDTEGCFFDIELTPETACLCRINGSEFMGNKRIFNIVFMVDTSIESFDEQFGEALYNRTFVKIIRNVIVSTLPRSIDNIDQIRFEIIQYGSNPFTYLSYIDSLSLTIDQIGDEIRDMGAFTDDRNETIGSVINTTFAIEYALNRFELMNDNIHIPSSDVTNLLYIFTYEQNRDPTDAANACNTRPQIDDLSLVHCL